MRPFKGVGFESSAFRDNYIDFARASARPNKKSIHTYTSKDTRRRFESCYPRHGGIAQWTEQSKRLFELARRRLHEEIKCPRALTAKAYIQLFERAPDC